MVVLVRHAHAGSKKDWEHLDLERPLSALGLQQADGLVGSLRGVPVAAMFTSRAVRCRQTLAPLAGARQLTPVDHPLLGIGQDIEDLLELILQPKHRYSLWCTHGEVFNALARLAAVRKVVKEPRTLPNAKGSAWVFDPDHHGVPRVTYVPPVPRH